MVKESKHKLHQKYFLKNGMEVVGASTVAGLLDKGMGMVGGAVKLTKAGLDYRKIWDEKRDAGTLLHLKVLSDFTGKPIDISTFTGNMIERADNSMLSFYEWKKIHKIEPLHLEREMVSEKMKVGGTADFIGLIDSVAVLADYKSGGLYDSAYIQLAGYGLIAEEIGIKVERLLLLNTPQTEDYKFLDIYLTDKERQIYGDIFKALCSIYWLKAELKVKD